MCCCIHVDKQVCGQIVDMHSRLSVQWQDNTITHNISSIDLLSKDIVMDTDHVPNDYIINKHNQQQVGYIVSVDTIQQMCAIVWLTDLSGNYISEHHTIQCSVHDVYSTDELELTLYEYIVNQSPASTHYNEIGCIIGYSNGLLNIQYVDNQNELLRYCDVISIDLVGTDDYPPHQQQQPSTIHSTVSHPDVTPISTFNIDTQAQHLSTYSSFTVSEIDPQSHRYYNNTVQFTNKLKQRITTEWAELQSNLSHGIHVTTYEQRIDLLQFMIIGSVNTPYYNTVHLFDLQLSTDYPNTPPHVHYHSNGYRVSPNLYIDGNVCLSLLNTWPSTHTHHSWQSSSSNLLQVCISIQGLILGSIQPYYLEHTYEQQAGNSNSMIASRVYNESVVIGSLNSLYRLLQSTQDSVHELIHTHWRHHDTQNSLQQLMNGIQHTDHIQSIQSLNQFGIVLDDTYTLKHGFITSLRAILQKLIIE